MLPRDRPLDEAGGRTIPMGGRTEIIRREALNVPSKPHLVAPKELDLGALRGGETARDKLRLANNGTGLLTGSARVGPDQPWLRIPGSGSIYCAAGAVEAFDVQVDTAGLPPGKHLGSVIIESDGGQAIVQIVVVVFRDSWFPAAIAAVITAVAVLGIVGLVYASKGGKLPLVAQPAATATASATATATATPSAPPTETTSPTASVTPASTATSADIGATATAEAQRAQTVVANAGATATALAASANATGTAVVLAVANQAPGATQERLAIQAAVNNFLLVRTNALRTLDTSKLASVAMGRELSILQQNIEDLRKKDSYTTIRSIDPPVWDSITLNPTDAADATMTKHEDEIIVRNSTGLPDDGDPGFQGKPGTLRNQRFAVTYHMARVNGTWLVADFAVIDAPAPLPTPQADLLPPPGSGPITSSGTATALPTVPVSSGLTIEDVVKEALPSVLRVTGTIANNQQSTGTGFVIRTSDTFFYVVTNDHVVNGAANIVLATQDGTSMPAIAVQEDSADDLAVIKVAQPARGLRALSWGDSDSAQLGENVVAIGFALGLQGEPTISSGILSALHRDVGQRWRYLQHTAPINHGNSGGPLLDLNGTVIGVNTLLDENAQSVYFAIPSSRARQKIADLIGAMP